MINKTEFITFAQSYLTNHDSSFCYEIILTIGCSVFQPSMYLYLCFGAFNVFVFVFHCLHCIYSITSVSVPSVYLSL